MLSHVSVSERDNRAKQIQEKYELLLKRNEQKICYQTNKKLKHVLNVTERTKERQVHKMPRREESEVKNH